MTTLTTEQEDTLIGVVLHAKDLRQHSLDELIELGYIILTDNKDYGYQLTTMGNSLIDLRNTNE